MSDDVDRKYFWCLKHKHVEDDENACGWADRLGPYDTESQAQQALQLVAERNKKLDAEDERWEGG
ncbi:MAG: hypothetical protein M3042_07630 [Actinomycetota bacterium]|nr:hypothetical protein [Actinomycetota bacterium]